MLNRPGTQTYSKFKMPIDRLHAFLITLGSPENFTDEANDFLLRTVQEASRSKDIWALGCVFSQVAVWSVFGVKGLLRYQKVRTEAIRKIPKLQSSAYSECFHNGQNVLPEVLAYHTKVYDSMRNSDHVTGRILDLVREMLKPHPGDRPSARRVLERCHDIIEQAEDLQQINMRVDEDEPFPDVFKLGRTPLSTPQGLGLESIASMDSPHKGWPTPQHPGNTPSRPLQRMEPSELPPPVTATPSFSHRSHHANRSLDATVCTSFNASTPIPNPSESPQYSPASRGEQAELNHNGQPLEWRHSVPNTTPNIPKLKQNKRASAPLLLQPTLEVKVDENPKITINEVIGWINSRKSGVGQPLRHLGLLKKLHGRDQVVAYLRYVSQPLTILRFS